MKLLNYLRLICLIGLGVTFASLQAQVCVPDTSYQNSGVHPSNIPPGCLNQYYEQTMTVVVPEDTTVMGFTAQIDSIVLEQVLNLPPGISYACEPISCGYPGGTSGCALFSGTPTVADTFDVQIIVTFYVVTFAGPLNITDTLDQSYEIIIHPSPTGLVSVIDASCGVSDGSATVTASGGTGPYTYAWSNGDTTATAENLAAGIYTVVVSDANGCGSDTLTANVGSAGGATVDAATTVISLSGCAESGNGNIDLAVTGGTMPYTFLWSNGDTTQDLTNAPFGSYTVTITDAVGCVGSGVLDLTAPAIMNITLDSQTDPSCFGEADGTATVAVAGGAGTYTYDWNTTPNQTTATANDLVAGMYQVSVTDSLGCAKTFDVTVGEPDSLVANIGGVDESTAGANDGAAGVAPSGGSSPYTYLWSNAATTDSIMGLAPGVYSVTITDANGCTSIDSVEVGTFVSIEDELAAGINEFILFPNPTSGIMTVQVSLASVSPMTLHLFDMTGKILFQEEVSLQTRYQHEFDLSGKPAGIYLMRLSTDKGSATRRVILR